MSGIIVGLTGLTGCGKTTVACHLEEKGFGVVRLGEYLRYLRQKEDFITEDMEKFAEAYKDRSIGEYLKDEINGLMIDKKIVVVDSLRTLADYNFFESLADRFFLITLLSNKSDRRTRTIARGRKGDGENNEQLQMHEIWEMDFGLKNLIVLSDYFITNDTDIMNLMQKIMQIIKKEGIENV